MSKLRRHFVRFLDNHSYWANLRKVKPLGASKLWKSPTAYEAATVVKVRDLWSWFERMDKAHITKEK